MKKILRGLALALSAVMVLAIVGCGDDSDDSTSMFPFGQKATTAEGTVESSSASSTDENGGTETTTEETTTEELTTPEETKEDNNPAAAAVKPGYLLYKNQEKGVQMIYPEGWTMTENQSGAVVAFQPPMSPESLNLVIQDGVGSYSMDSFLEECEVGLKSIFPDSKIVSDKSETLLGQKAYSVFYTITQSGITMEMYQVFTIIDGKAYILTYGSMEGGQEHKREIEEIMASLILIM